MQISFPPPKKRFGQHFLNDPNILKKIISALTPLPEERLVEIGPGQGALTQHIVPLSGHIYAIEIDHDLYARLKNRFSEAELSLFRADVLDFDFSTLIGEQKLRIVGNLPYNISTPILFHLLGYADYIQDMHFLLQKEVVQRLSAKPDTKHYGRLSVMIQYACEVQSLFLIKPQSFTPPPKVDSAVVRLVPRPFPLLCHQLDYFTTLVKQGFQYRRKTLSKALQGLAYPHQLEQAHILPQQRAETLSVVDWVRLANTGSGNRRN